MEATLDSFRALARSSPWRWRTLHFTRRGDIGEVEAWLRRPGELLVRRAGHPDEYVTGVPYSTGLRMVSWPVHELPVTEPDPPPVIERDGLVTERPPDWHLRYGDPMWHDYTWTAALDPEELSHDVAAGDVRRVERDGRDTWRARLVPEPGYEPRCGCCPLLWSRIAAVAEYGDEPDRLARFDAEGYPEAHDVSLDVQTGVVVDLTPIGGDLGVRGFTVAIHEVDADLDEVFAGPRSGRVPLDGL